MPTLFSLNKKVNRAIYALLGIFVLEIMAFTLNRQEIRENSAKIATLTPRKMSQVWVDSILARAARIETKVDTLLVNTKKETEP